MAAQTKNKLDALISEGHIQHIYGLVGCCKNYFVQFPNDTQKYMYNPNKPISAKLINKISNYVYTNTVMSSSSSGNPAESQPQVAGKRLTKKTNPSATTYEQPQGKRLTKKTKPSETNYGNIHHKSVNKIIRMLGRTIKMKITKTTNSLKKNTHTIDVNPTYVGKNQYAHIEALLDKAFTQAKTQIKHNNYKIYTYMQFPSHQGGDDFEVRSNTYDKEHSYKMLADVVDKAKELVQSDREVKLKDFMVSFNIVRIPDGGARSV